ncbi:hypothetical protein DWX41_02890 [Hungatella hathewayi]|uniref:Uncharacterized protein n=1 Tax=Hungatella hathewayi TaxID=154046 RepID=A0A3E2X1J2_9FIRM|nr:MULTISPECIES: hypothetical protein [Clostridia]RGC35148.1 hypothetical protein DWX41_02890 [Hungatella hathewayi]GKH35124.1 hypothetical protein CE91St64_45310 [Faecalicatena contorta]
MEEKEKELLDAIRPIKRFAKKYGYKHISAAYIEDNKTEFLNAFSEFYEQPQPDIDVFEMEEINCI